MGHVHTALGEAERIELTDAVNIRRYDVSRDGVLLRTVYAAHAPNRPVVLVVDGVALLPTVPDPAMFDERSLARSYVPDRYRTRPR